MTAAADTLPVVDLTPGPGADERIAGEIGQAARGVGFFFVTGHGIPTTLIDEVFGESARFFALDLEEKEKRSIRTSPHNRGYVAMQGESLDPSMPADLKEAFNIGLDLSPDDPRVIAGEPFRGVNLWPDLPGWRDTMLTYFDAVWSVGRRLHRGVAIDLGLAPDFFEDKLDQPMATLRLLHYPTQPVSAAEGQIGAGAHTDYGDVTLLLTDDVGGLEVRTRRGEWITVPPRPGTFVCNIGDCLMRWTNDLYVSTPHRVVNRGDDRYSVAFFLDPNPDATIACLPTCVPDGEPARYPPISGADYLMDRLARTYDFLAAGRPVDA
ncbi:MAG: isopenicillin N synthase family oxygenase [Bauldia sp.]|uniref:isopenicillin N synthase family dioxygenase n=1 Tax=Bauldia sp. TaxID=2575872 RepID=UPI001DC92CD3|nr:2-oxoglutarate and iron-dependent oxygenase domain-containing protein [Bauldia sp.]MCB1494984.1 isopenicillin N synthase family oxygenase [Bauldia sp.]